MMSDSDIIDNVNPFVDYPPGVWSKPYPFSGYMKLKEEPFKEHENTPVCDIATTAGDKQIDWCKPGIPNCPMSRELEPTQRVDPDISYTARGDLSFGQIDRMVELSNKFDKQFLINIIVLILFILIVIRLTEQL